MPTESTTSEVSQSQSEGRGIGVGVVVVLVVLASMFMPWGTAPINSMTGPKTELNQALFAPLLTAMGSVTFNGWNGSVTLMGIAVPDWMVLVLAVAAVGLALTRGSETRGPPRGLIYLLLIAAIVQCAVVVAVLAGSKDGTAGIGPIVGALALVAFMFYGVSSRGRIRRQKPA